MFRKFFIGAATITASLVFAAPSLAASCGPAGYAYAGLASDDNVYGVSTTLTMLSQAQIENGHVAGWIGVGGPGLGPNGSDEWIQVGMSALPWSLEGHIYVEVQAPSGYKYTEVGPALVVGQAHNVAITETAPAEWQVVVDGQAWGAPVALPGSHGEWQLIATGESWDGGKPSCNRFAYKFEQIKLQKRFGGAWRIMKNASPIESDGYSISQQATAGFVATTT